MKEFNLKELGKEIQSLEMVKAEKLENAKDLQQKAISLLQDKFLSKFKDITTNNQEAINLWIALDYDLKTTSILQKTLLKFAKSIEDQNVIMKINKASNSYLHSKNKKALDFAKAVSNNFVTKCEVNNNLKKLGLSLTNKQIEALQNEYVRVSLGKMDKLNGKKALFDVLTIALQNANALPAAKSFNIDLGSLKQIIIIPEKDVFYTESGRPQYSNDNIIEMFQQMQWLNPEKFDLIDLNDYENIKKYINNCLNMCAILTEKEAKALENLMAKVKKEKGE